MAMASMANTEFGKLLKPVALELLGKPDDESGSEWRYGSRGSLCVNIDRGVWHNHEKGTGGGTLDLIQQRLSLNKAGALGWLRDRKLIDERAAPTGSRRIIATYDYCDLANAVVFQVVRYDPKDFRQRRPDGKGGWVWKMAGVQLLPFHLPELRLAIAAGRTIYIVEGEKGVLSLEGIGMAATCSPGGAGKWQQAYAPHFAGAEVVILPDADRPGEQHALQVALALKDVAASVRMLPLPGISTKGDIADWIAGGGTAAQLEALARMSGEPAPHPKRNVTSDANDAERELRFTLENCNPTPGEEAPEWQTFLQLNRDKEARGNLANAMTALTNAPEWRDKLGFDLMQRAAVMRHPNGDLCHLEDVDVSNIQLWMQHNGLPTIGSETTNQAVNTRAQQRKFHPVQRYLAATGWDSKLRLDDWLTTYLGAEATPYTKRIGRMFLIAMVARVHEPGCKADYMVILEGPQGSRKSTACRILGGTYFSDCLPDLDRDAVRVAQHLRGKWLIEIGELSAMNKADSNLLKEFITRPAEDFTPKYGRREVHEPRQCIFIGTTNKAAYLRDETGGRRFWPVKVGRINTDDLARDRAQLFAEAFVGYKAGEAWWPDGAFERDHVAPQQAARFEGDAWDEVVEAFLAARKPATVLMVAREALLIETSKIGTADQRRIIAIMERLGWERGPRGNKGERFFYPRPAA